MRERRLGREDLRNDRDLRRDLDLDRLGEYPRLRGDKRRAGGEIRLGDKRRGDKRPADTGVGDIEKLRRSFLGETDLVRDLVRRRRKLLDRDLERERGGRDVSRPYRSLYVLG